MRILRRNGYKINGDPNNEKKYTMQSCVKCSEFNKCMRGRDKDVVWADCAQYGCMKYFPEQVRIPKDTRDVEMWVRDKVYVLRPDEWDVVRERLGDVERVVLLLGEELSCLKKSDISKQSLDTEMWMRWIIMKYNHGKI